MLRQEKEFTGYSFDGANTNTRTYEHNARQVQYYYDLCEQKHVKPELVEIMTGKQLRDSIDMLRKLPYPATLNQKETIVSTIEELISLGSERSMLPEAYLNRLTKDNASTLIQELFEERKVLGENAPPSREQLLTLCTWYICPDIPFEDFGISKVVYLEEMKAWSYETDKGTGAEVRLFRQMTANEFAREISRVFKRVDATAFINQFSQTYYEWKKSRITDSQIARIRQLESFLATTTRGKSLVWTEDGYDTQYIGDTREARDEVRFEPITERTLRMFSKEEARTFINQLQSELADTTLRYNSPYDDSQERLEYKHSTYNQAQRNNEYRADNGESYTRLTKNEDDAKQKEVELLNNIIIWAESRVGHNNDELRNIVEKSLISGNTVYTQQAKKQLEDFLIMTIDTSSADKIDKSLKSLYSVLEPSQYAIGLFYTISALFKEE